jgi:hypothetical protein
MYIFCDSLFSGTFTGVSQYVKSRGAPNSVEPTLRADLMINAVEPQKNKALDRGQGKRKGRSPRAKGHAKFKA